MAQRALGRCRNIQNTLLTSPKAGDKACSPTSWNGTVRHSTVKYYAPKRHKDRAMREQPHRMSTLGLRWVNKLRHDSLCVPHCSAEPYQGGPWWADCCPASRGSSCQQSHWGRPDLQGWHRARQSEYGWRNKSQRALDIWGNYRNDLNLAKTIFPTISLIQNQRKILYACIERATIK